MFHEKLTVAYLVMKFLIFYETWRSKLTSTRARHWSLSWGTWTQFTFLHPTSPRSIL